MAAKSVAIMGGGVGGIAAALSLADTGLQVLLLEKRPLLGGRASSYLDAATGERLDECQHGTMRCCTNLADLLERLGVHDQIQYFGVIDFLDSDGKRSVIKGSNLPAPLHTAPSFLRFRSLGLQDKIAIGRGMLKMLRGRPDPKRDSEDIATWFRRNGQTERAVKRFWEPVIISACNESLDRVSCLHAFKLFRDGFLRNARSFEFGIPRLPLGSLYTEPTLAYLTQRGGCVRTRTTVDKMEFEGGPRGRVTGLVLQDGERIEADYYVSALQCDLLLKLLPPEVTAGIDYWENLRQIALSPIIGIHVWFDRPLDCPPAIALLDRETDWIFYKNKLFAQNEQEGAYLSMVISAPGKLAAVPKDDVLKIVLEEVRAAIPDARTARVVRSRVITWPKATLAPKPDGEQLRPDQRSPISNLYVAGEWTRTDWPSTMEGAARSGYRAAEYILAAEGRPQALVAPDLPASFLFRLLDGQKPL